MKCVSWPHSNCQINVQGYHFGSADNYLNQEMYARCHVASVTSSGKNPSGCSSPEGDVTVPSFCAERGLAGINSFLDGTYH